MAVEWSADTDARLATLGHRIEDAMARSHVPGVAVGLLHEGREYAAGFGVTNVNHALPVDADTLFQIGSITKTFTATLAMHLVERGVLALDEPVRTYLPDLRLADETTAAHVTMRHLLTHTAGWEGEPEPESLAADIVAWLAGRYHSRLYDIELCLVDEALRLTLIFTRGFPRAESPVMPPVPPAPVLQIGPDTLQVMDGRLKGTRVEILRQQDGSMLGLRMLSRLFVRRA